MLLRRTATIKLTLICIALFFVIYYVYNFGDEDEQNETELSKNIKLPIQKLIDQSVEKSIEKKETIKTEISDVADIMFFDLGNSLEPSDIYDQVKCRKSAKFIVETTLCVHPIEKDIYVSLSIWNNGFWEEKTLSN